MQVNPEDSQFIELMRLTDEQVCRYMGTPPEGSGSPWRVVADLQQS